MGSEPVVPMHEHALDNLRYIREAMERAGSFTSIPGWGGVAVGLTALVACAIGQSFLPAYPRSWMLVWLIEAAVAAPIAFITMVIKGRRATVSFNSLAARRFFVSYFAPLLAGAGMTALLGHMRIYSSMPALWLLLYGSSFVSSGAFSIRVIPVMGAAFMLLGFVALFVPLPIGNVLMGAGFGGLHIVFGWIIARRFGG